MSVLQNVAMVLEVKVGLEVGLGDEVPEGERIAERVNSGEGEELGEGLNDRLGEGLGESEVQEEAVVETEAEPLALTLDVTSGDTEEPNEVVKEPQDVALAQ